MEWYGFGDLSPALLYEVLRFRQAIFVVEQSCAFPDLDGRDQGAQHLLLRVDGELAGCLRLVPFSAEAPGAIARGGVVRLLPFADEARVAIGRVAVAAPLRRQGFARSLMREALAHCRRNYPD